LEQDTSFVYALSIVFYLIVVADMSKEAVRLLKAVVVGDATAWQLRKIGDEYAFLLMWPRAKRAWVDAVGKQARERDVLIEQNVGEARVDQLVRSVPQTLVDRHGESL
jgi:hypothetical protein